MISCVNIPYYAFTRSASYKQTRFNIFSLRNGFSDYQVKMIISQFWCTVSTKIKPLHLTHTNLTGQCTPPSVGHSCIMNGHGLHLSALYDTVTLNPCTSVLNRYINVSIISFSDVRDQSGDPNNGLILKGTSQHPFAFCSTRNESTEPLS